MKLAICGICLRPFPNLIPDDAGDVVCFGCDILPQPRSTTPMTVDPNLSVYRVPFSVTLTGAAFIIAESPGDALRKAGHADIGDYLSVDDNEATIDSEQGELLDFGPIAFYDDPAQVAEDTDYPVEDHPDYDPSEHDEPGDEPEDKTPTDLPKPNEGLKS